MTGTWIKVARLSANALFPAPLLPIITVRWLRDWNIGLTADICRAVHTLIESIERGRSFQSWTDQSARSASGFDPFRSAFSWTVSAVAMDPVASNTASPDPARRMREIVL